MKWTYSVLLSPKMCCFADMRVPIIRARKIHVCSCWNGIARTNRRTRIPLLSKAHRDGPCLAVSWHDLLVFIDFVHNPTDSSASTELLNCTAIRRYTQNTTGMGSYLVWCLPILVGSLRRCEFSNSYPSNGWCVCRSKENKSIEFSDYKGSSITHINIVDVWCRLNICSLWYCSDEC